MAVVVGEGGSGGALALATANRVLMMANSVYSVISPEGCAAILWKGTDAVPRAARALRMTARDLLSLGVVDGVVPEPIGGSGADHLASAQHLRAALRECLGELAALSAEQLVEHRRRRFERFGVGDLRADGATLTGPA
jgi:acetyl-CoA carboxylase carboxyl transferase subunit beta